MTTNRREDHEIHEDWKTKKTSNRRDRKARRANACDLRPAWPAAQRWRQRRRNHKRSIAVVCVGAPLASARPAGGPVARSVFFVSFVDLRVFVVKGLVFASSACSSVKRRNACSVIAVLCTRETGRVGPPLPALRCRRPLFARPQGEAGGHRRQLFTAGHLLLTESIDENPSDRRNK